MTQHDHREYVEGCFRCDLSRDENIWPKEPTGIVKEALREYVGDGEGMDVRTLAEHDAEILEKAAEDYTNIEGATRARPHARTWLRERAQRIRNGE